MKIVVKNAGQLRTIMNASMKEFKKSVLKKLSQETSKIITEGMEGVKISTSYISDGFITGVEKTIDDPSGARIKDVERSVGAFKAASDFLTNKAMVIRLIDRKDI